MPLVDSTRNWHFCPVTLSKTASMRFAAVGSWQWSRGTLYRGPKVKTRVFGAKIACDSAFCRSAASMGPTWVSNSCHSCANDCSLKGMVASVSIDFFFTASGGSLALRDAESEGRPIGEEEPVGRLPDT